MTPLGVQAPSPCRLGAGLACDDSTIAVHVYRTRDYEDPQQRQRRDSDDDTNNEKNDDGPKTAKTTGSDDGDDDTEKDSDDAGESTGTGDGIDETKPAPPKQGRAPYDRYSFVGPYKRVWVLVNHISAG